MQCPCANGGDPQGSSCCSRGGWSALQQLISAEITDEGHACFCFGSAEDFLDEAGSDRFDLLLLDLMLPGMDGLACLKQLQLQAASQPALRVVIVTALNDADKKHEALANGAEAYVLKPDLFEQLPQLLQTRSMV